MASIVLSLSLAMAIEQTKPRSSDYSTRALVYSFNDSYYLIQVNNFIYQIKNLDLADQDAYLLKKIILEGHVTTVNSSIKNDSLLARRFMASEEFKEIVRISDEGLTISGTLLYNDLYNDSTSTFLIIKSNDYIYQVKKQHIFSSTPELQNSYQSKIEVSVPIEDVKYIWTTRLVKTLELNH
jgi:hypothetical protein